MAQLELNYCSAYYGWSSDRVAAGTSSLYMGNCYNGSTWRNYDSCLGYQATEDIGGNIPIVITKISCLFKVRSVTYPTSPLSIYINQIGGKANAYYDAYNGEGFVGLTGSNESAGEKDKYFGFTFSHEENPEVFTKLATYLKNKELFFIHWYSSTSKGGGVATAAKVNTKLTIEWEYAKTEGKLNYGTFQLGQQAQLTIFPNSSNFAHKVTWVINGISSPEQTGESGTENFFYSFQRTAKNIRDFFPYNSKTSKGEVIIKTYSSNECTTLLGTTIIPFSLFLSASDYIATKYLKINSVTLSPKIPSGFPKGYYYIKNGRVQITLQHYSYSSKSSPKIVCTFTGGVQGSFTSRLSSNSAGSLLSTNYSSSIIASKTDITVKIELSDSRGISFSQTETISSNIIKDYHLPIITISELSRREANGDFSVSGEYLGGNFTVESDSSTTLKTVKVSATGLTSYTDSPSLAYKSYNSTNLSPKYFLSNLLTTKSYTITITAIDSLGGQNNKSYTISSAKYLIHFPKGGNGLGLGTTAESNGRIKIGMPIDGLDLYEGNILYNGEPFKEYLGDLNILNDKNLITTLEKSSVSIYGGAILSGTTRVRYPIITLQDGSSANCAALNFGNSSFSTKIIGFDSNLTYNNKVLLDTTNYSTYVPNLANTTPTLSYPTLNSEKFEAFKKDSETENDYTSGYYQNGLEVRKWGKLVQFEGAITPIASLSGGVEEIEICTLSENYRPIKLITQVCQGSTQNTWLLRVRPNGQVTFSRYRHSGEWINCPAGAWLTFHVCFLVA